MDEKRIEWLKARIAQHPKNELDRWVLAGIYFDASNWGEAIKEYREILSLKPDYLLCHVRLGEALLRQGSKDEARKVLEAARPIAIAQKHQGPLDQIEELLSEFP